MKSIDHKALREILQAWRGNRPANSASKFVFEEAPAGNPSEAGQSPSASEISSVKLSDLIPLERVSRMLPRRTHRSTVFRWAQKGCHGVRLRVVAVGGVRCTTERWLMAFFEATEQARGVISDATTLHARRGRRRPNETSRLARTGEVLRRHGLDVSQS